MTKKPKKRKPKKTKIKTKSVAPPVLNGTGVQRAFRFKELAFLTGLKRTQLRELIKKKQFPDGVRAGPDSRTKIWFENWIASWQSERGAAR